MPAPNLNPGQTVSFTVSPVTGQSPPQPSQATLSNLSFLSSDPTIFTVAPDPSTPNGGIVTAVGAGTASVSATALATEPDGKTTETISGTDTVTVTAVTPPPPPPPAATLSFSWGTPVTPGAATPAVHPQTQ